MNDSTAAGVPTCYRHPDRETYISCQRCERSICPDCMREASVGFQCPECVSEGHRTTRQARTAFGGARSATQGVVTLTLIGINLAVFAAVLATGGSSSRLVEILAMHTRGVCHLNGAGYFVTQAMCERGQGSWVPGLVDGGYWQLLTSMFLHVQVLHIGFNMLALYVLGPQLEHALGRVRFVALYLLSGLAGSALVYWAAGEHTVTLGASGAIFGLMAALLVIARKVGADYQQIAMWIGLNFLITVIGSSYISWQGHLGGFIGGLAIAAILAYAPSGPRRTTLHVVGMSAVGVAIAVAVVARTLVLG